jgi:hypothetical protein
LEIFLDSIYSIYECKCNLHIGFAIDNLAYNCRDKALRYYKKCVMISKIMRYLCDVYKSLYNLESKLEDMDRFLKY